MLKRDRIRQKQGDTGRTRRTEREVLMKVSTFFNTPTLLIITNIDGNLYSRICGTGYSGIVACFIMKIEHENLQRNNEKNNTLEPLPDP